MPRKKFTEDYFDFDNLNTKPKKTKTTSFSSHTSKILFPLISSFILIIYIIYSLFNGRFKNTVSKAQTNPIQQSSTSAVVDVYAENNEADDVIESAPPSTKEDNSKQINSFVQIYNNNDILMAVTFMDTQENIIFTTPVAKTVNNTFYLDHDFYKHKNAIGSVFTDTDINFDDKITNLTLYGSNQSVETPFYFIEQYKNVDYFNKNNQIKVETYNDTSVYKVFAFSILDNNFKTEPISFESNESFDSYLNNIKTTSIYPFNDVSSSDSIISVVTSSNNSQKERYILYGKKIS